MFFRNLTLFRFSAAAGRSLDALDEALAQHRLRPCGPLEMATRGFISPLGDDEEALTRRLGDCTLFSLGGEDKILPAAVVNAETSARARALAQQQQRKVGGKRRRQIKAEVLDELLPRAFSKPSRLDAYLDHKHGWLVIDSASRKAAEGLLTALRQALEGFPALPPAPGETPRRVLTDWLTSGQLPAGLEFGDACELRDSGNAGGAVVRCQHQALASDEIREHLRSGKQVFQLGLEFEGRLGFVLGEDLVVRKLRFNDVVTEELDQTDGDDAVGEIDARFTLMSLELERLLEHLSKWFKLPRPESSS